LTEIIGYGKWASEYRKSGWKGTLPLPPVQKKPVPVGFTGVTGAWPTADQVKSWARGKFKEGNVALRLPEDVIGIDVDHGYHGKTGMDTLNELIEKWGPLPPTYRSGSREVGGIYFFKVPKDHNLPGGAGKDIDIIQHVHRYAVVYPSIHPDTQNRYLWRDKDGEIIDYVPNVEDLPDLPDEWFEGLHKEGFARSAEAKLTSAEISDWLGALNKAEEHCDRVQAQLTEGLTALDGAAGSRHDATLKHVWALLGLGATGHGNVIAALDKLEAAYVDTVGPDRTGGPKEAEADFRDMVHRGVKKRASTFEHPAKHCGCDVVAGDATGQIRFARRFAREQEGKLLFVKGLGWLVWDGKKWARDDLNQVIAAAADTLDKAREYAKLLPAIPAAELYRDIKKCEGYDQLVGITKIASSIPTVSTKIDKLDEDPTLFNTDSGILDLQTGDVVPHDPAKLMTKISRGGVDKYQTAPTFERFLQEVLPDKPVRDYIQRLLGYALLGRVQEHILPIFTGTGANGKGTLLEAVMYAFGDYAISTEPTLLIDKGQAHPTGQADLFGVRLAVTSETNEKEKLAASTVKRLTGGDTIKARYMRQDFFQFKPSHTIIMMTNHKPDVNGDDAAMWRRITVVPFDVVIPAERMDGSLPMKLEAEATPILTWIAKGYQEYLKQGLNAPEAVQMRTQEYRSETDTVAQFLATCTRVEEDEASTTGEMYNAYVTYCRENGEEWLSSSKFKESLDRHSITQRVVKMGGKSRRIYHKAGDPKARLVVGEPKESPEPQATPPAPIAEGNSQVKPTHSPDQATPVDTPVTSGVPLNYQERGQRLPF